MRRTGFVLDLDRCTGCNACEFACRIENDLPPGTSFRHVTTFNPWRFPDLPVLHLSLACNHCERPACLAACPTGAYTRNAATGAVDLHGDRCMGCTYCSWVCPYGAPQFDRERGVMAKCTFCAPRVERGGAPACVVACPVDALDVLENRAEPIASRRSHEVRIDSATVPGFPDTGLEPAIEFLSRRRWRARPHGGNGHPKWTRGKPQWARLRTEWPLAVFTFVVAGLVGWFGAGALGGPRPQAAPFLVLAGLGFGASALHLGRPARMWRALRNVRRSWISREIALVTAFMVAACVSFFFGPGSRASVGVTAGLGLAAAVAVDLVYRIPRQAVRAVPHSGMATLTALYLAGLLSGSAWLAAATASLKLVLYVVRHRDGWHGGTRWVLPGTRLTLGFLVPGFAWIAAGTPLHTGILASVLLAEALDRAEFYSELDFLTPERQVQRDSNRFDRRETAIAFEAEASRSRRSA